VREQDRAESVHHVQRRRVQMQQRHQSEVEPAARADERVERGGDDERGHDERDARECAQQSLSAKLVARDQIRSGQADEEREQRRERGLPKREGEHLPQVSITCQRREGAEVKMSLRRKAEAQNRGERVKVEQTEEEQRNNEQC
jgi:hypothetical protein